MASGTLWHRARTRVRTVGGDLAASLGLSLAGGVNLAGALGVGGIPAAGFGAGTPLADLTPFASIFESPALVAAGIDVPARRAPWSALGYFTQRGLTSFGQAPGYGWAREGVPVNLLSSSGGFNDPVFTSGGGGWGGTDWGGIINAIGGATFGYLNAKNQTKQLKQLAKLRLNVPQIGSPLANPLAGIGGLGFDLGGGAIGGAVGGGVLGGEIGGPVGAGIGGALGGLAGSLLGGGTTTRTHAPRLVGAWNSDTNTGAFYRYVGKPVLFQGDVTNLKRTRKLIRRFASPAGLMLGAGRRRRRRCR